MALGAVLSARRSWAIAVLLAGGMASGCGSAPPLHTPGQGVVDVSLPAVPIAVAPLAAIVDDSSPPTTTTYALRLVDTAAHTAASLHPKRRGDDSAAPTCKVARLPVVSASAHRVFFLDGDSTLKFLDPDGTTGTIRGLGNDADTEVAFAVSPDETRMALVTVVLTTGGFHEEVAVESLGGAGAVVIFTRDAAGTGSSGEVSWPVGWHGDQLVLADGVPTAASNCDSVPQATGYDLVDPLTGAARLHFCISTTDAAPSGPPVAAGVFCVGHQGSTGPSHAVAILEAWDGTPATFAVSACGLSGVLAPDGSRAAVTLAQPGGGTCSPGDGQVDLLSGGGVPAATVASGTPLGWLDGGHVVVATGASLSIFDSAAGQLHHSSAAGSLEAVLPPLL